ncbi:MAG: hypothetical protein HUU10_04440 [Bacteroidetes bacterium]|nr:hypothetical protein [Bacteroidota bacterium]
MAKQKQNAGENPTQLPEETKPAEPTTTTPEEAATPDAPGVTPSETQDNNPGQTSDTQSQSPETPAYEPKVRYKHFNGGSGVVNVSLTVEGESVQLSVKYDNSTGIVTDPLTDEQALQLTETTHFNLVQ